MNHEPYSFLFACSSIHRGDYLSVHFRLQIYHLLYKPYVINLWDVGDDHKATFFICWITLHLGEFQNAAIGKK